MAWQGASGEVLVMGTTQKHLRCLCLGTSRRSVMATVELSKLFLDSSLRGATAAF